MNRNNRPDDWTPEDDDPEYSTPFGKLPSAQPDQPEPAPIDPPFVYTTPADVPTGEPIDFTAADFTGQTPAPQHSAAEREAMNDALTYLAMLEQRTKCMREPARILKAMRKEIYDSIKIANKLEDEAADITDPEKQSAAAANAAKFDALRKFWKTAIETWALEITLAMNDTLEALAQKAENELPGILNEETADWLRAEIYHTRKAK